MASSHGLQQKELDQLFLYVAHQIKGVKPLLRAFFGFLQRQTDFYEASDEATQHMVLQVLHEYIAVHKSSKEKFVPIPTVETATIEEIVEPEKLSNQNINNVAETRDIKFKSKSKNKNAQNVNDTPNEKTVDSNTGDISTDEEDEKVFFEESRRTKKGSVYPNEGDGATFARYKWTQTPTELEILVPLCRHQLADKSSLLVKYSATTITSTILNKKVFGGTLADTIKPAEVTWTLEDGVLCVRAEKGRKCWWKQLLRTEPMLLLKPILRKHATVGDIGEETMREFQQTVVKKKEYAEARHLEQFPDKIPIPRGFEDKE